MSRPGAGETTIRHQESRHNHEAGVSSVNVFYDLGEDRGRGVADVSDGRAVEDHPSQLRPGPGHHGRARARTIGSTVWPCGNSFAIAVSMPGRLPPLLPPGRSARHPSGQRAAALATMSYLPAGLQWFFGYWPSCVHLSFIFRSAARCLSRIFFAAAEGTRPRGTRRAL